MLIVTIGEKKPHLLPNTHVVLGKRPKFHHFSLKDSLTNLNLENQK